MNTIARPASSAAAMTSSSRIEPPGWITAAIGIATAAQYLTAEKVATIGPQVAATAHAISRDLGYAD